MGRDTHLILAATDRMASIYHSVNHYPRLLPEQITNSTDHTTDDELADAARVVLDHMNNQKVSDIRQLFETRTAQGGGAVRSGVCSAGCHIRCGGTLLVDFDTTIPGTIDERTGEINIADKASAGTYDIIDEISARTLLHGGDVLSVRKADMPGDTAAAAIFALSCVKQVIFYPANRRCMRFASFNSLRYIAAFRICLFCPKSAQVADRDRSRYDNASNEPDFSCRNPGDTLLLL